MMRDGTSFRIAPYNGGSRPWVKIPDRVDYLEYEEHKKEQYSDGNTRQGSSSIDAVAVPGLPGQARRLPR